jgi:dCMP deaminase
MTVERQRPPRERVLMESAKLWALRSTCSRAQVGAVIARDGRILSTGYNGAPAGLSHCAHPDQEAGAGLLGSTQGIQEGCRASVHAEANAIAYAARHGIRLEGASLFTTLSPCVECAKLVINAGITMVYVDQMYRDPGGRQQLNAAGIYVQTLTCVESLTGQ